MWSDYPAIYTYNTNIIGIVCKSMLDNIAKGKLKRFFKDNTLVNQDFIKDGKQSVKNYVSSYHQDLKVVEFKRVTLG